ncbi:MAG: SDR family NAD(P)-dependent oxidoreductase [Christensenellales bacterium]
MRFIGKKVWITGANTPVGSALAVAMFAEGAKLRLSGVNTAPDGIEAECFPEEPETDDAAEKALAGWYDLDIYIHACRVVERASLMDCTHVQWERSFNANLMTAYCGSLHAVRHIGKDRGGAMLYISSIHAEKPTGCAFLYSVAQGGITMLMREASLDYGRLGIRVNSLLTGPIEGDINLFSSDSILLYDCAETKIPLGRLAVPEEIVKPALFLCSDEASYVNGAVFQVDGGFTGYYLNGDPEGRWNNGRA